MSTSLHERTRERIGENVRRIDGIPKTTGSFAYGSDQWHDGMLWGATLRSPHPHARIRRIDVGDALVSAGVQAVLTHEDVPGKKTYGLEIADQPVLPWDVVMHVGQPVAIVAAETPELAKRAASKIHVEYEPRESVLDMVAALDPAAPKLHHWGNVLRHVRIEHGDPDAKADVWIEGYYETAMQDQAALGPEAGIAIPAEDGGIDLIVSTQWLHADRQQIAPVLDLPEERVRMTLAGVGGAFGSREDLHMQIHACMLAMRTGRPVKMSYGREESFLSHVHRHPSRVWLRTGASRDGQLVSIRGRIVVDGGAFASSTSAVIANATTFLSGPYDVPNALLEGTAVYTNNPPCGAMRGFGAPQVCFAHEANLDRLARELGLDPVELRLRNAVSIGSVLPTGQVIRGSAPTRAVIERCRDLPMPESDVPARRHAMTFPGGAGNVCHGEGLRQGVGFAFGYKNVAYSEGFDDFHQARVTLSAGANGPVAEIHTAGVECGQGFSTIVAQIAREELGIQDVVLHTADTQVESAGSTSASRQTVMGGGAVQMACRAVAEVLFARALPGLQQEGTLGLADGQVVANGAPIADLLDLLDEPVTVTRTFHHHATMGFDERGQGDIHWMFSFGAQRAVVEVDEELGLVKVVQLASALDAGRALNPQAVEGQSEGGSAQGLGLALMEEIVLREGRIANASFTDYLIPTMLDMPPVVTTIVEDPEPNVAYGAKGIGEMATVVSTAAIVAAIRDATGRELRRAPVRPDDIVGLAEEREVPPWPPVPEVPGQRPMPEYFGAAPDQSELRPTT